jgi:hypothetical protein
MMSVTNCIPATKFSNLMNRKNDHSKKLLSAAIAGAVAFSFIAPALAQTTLITICYRGRTVQVPSYLFPTYQLQGATPGPCSVSP